MLADQVLKSKTKHELNSKPFSSLLECAILEHFETQSFSGFDALTFVRDTFGVSMSESTVYSTLYLMERDGALNGYTNGSKRIFNVTDWGKFSLEALSLKVDIDTFISKTPGTPSF